MLLLLLMKKLAPVDPLKMKKTLQPTSGPTVVVR
jgi:hypothetical protein